MDAKRLKGIEYDGLAGAEKRALKRPSAVAAEYGAFKIGEREVGFPERLAYAVEPRRLNSANVVLDEGLAGYGNREDIGHDWAFPAWQSGVKPAEMIIEYSWHRIGERPSVSA
ncbi:hypothetical protein D3C71_1306510 [compost metagenome]